MYGTAGFKVYNCSSPLNLLREDQKCEVVYLLTADE